MNLTARQKFIVRAALSYALSNIDDLNDALAVEPDDGSTDAISVGGVTGPLVEETGLQSLIDLFEPPSRSAPKGLRAFKGTFIVAIDQNEADEEQPVSLDDLSAYLKEALILEIHTEKEGNLVGFQSAELLFDTLDELSADTVRRLYGK